MGRTRIDRLDPPMASWPAKVEVGPAPLNNICTKQLNGDAFYGEFIYPSPKRARRAYVNPALLFAQQQIEWQPVIMGVADPLEFKPPPLPEMQQEDEVLPEPVVPVPHPILSAPCEQPPMMRLLSAHADVLPAPAELPPPTPPPPPPPKPLIPPANPRDHEELIATERGLGKTWPDIAKMIPGCSADMVRKHYNSKMKPKIQAAKLALEANETPAPRGSSADAEVEVTAAGPRASTPTAATKPSKEGGARGKGTPGASKGKAGSAPHSRRESPRLRESEAEPVELDARCTDRAGGDARVKMLEPTANAPPDNTVAKAHGLTSLQGVSFYGGVEVVDPDDTNKVYVFMLEDKVHCACFNIGVGPEESPIISWSDLHCLYCLPDGTKWAEHGNYHDMEDLEDIAKKKGVEIKSLLKRVAEPQELFKRYGRFHSRLQNIELECWVSHGVVPKIAGLPDGDTDLYFWTSMFDPVKMTVTKIDKPPSEGAKA